MMKTWKASGKTMTALTFALLATMSIGAASASGLVIDTLALGVGGSVPAQHFDRDGGSIDIGPTDLPAACTQGVCANGTDTPEETQSFGGPSHVDTPAVGTDRQCFAQAPASVCFGNVTILKQTRSTVGLPPMDAHLGSRHLDAACNRAEQLCSGQTIDGAHVADIPATHTQTPGADGGANIGKKHIGVDPHAGDKGTLLAQRNVDTPATGPVGATHSEVCQGGCDGPAQPEPSFASDGDSVSLHAGDEGSSPVLP